MQRYVTKSGALLWLLGAAVCVAADESKPIEGTLLVGEHTYKLAHVVAYETKSGDKETITVLASDRKIPVEKIKVALREGEGSDERLSLRQPHVMVTFRKSGEAVRCKAFADNGSFDMEGEVLTGELKIENGRVRGQSRLATQRSGKLLSGFDFRLNVALGVESTPKPAAKPAAPVKPLVSGSFNGNGKGAKLAYVSARPGEPFNDQPSIVLVFTEKDHSKEKRPDIKAGFGDFGSALIISLDEDGSIFGCQVAHAAHAKRGFTSLGSIRTASLDLGEGRVEGQIKTDGEVTTFDQTWEVDIKFVAPFAAPEPKPVAADPPSSKKRRDTSPTGKPGLKPEPAKRATSLSVHDLALPKDASDIEYKKLVEQMVFNSPSAVQALAGDLSKKLAAQGWKEDGGDLVTPKSAILRRTRGDATLTIFVKPAAKGSQVTIMSTGLDWADKEE